MFRVNKEFRKFKTKMPGPMTGYPLKATSKYFVWYFNYAVLDELKFRFYNRKTRKVWIEMMSNPEFILENLGLKKYTYKKHRYIWKKWEGIKRVYDEEIQRVISTARSNQVAQLLKEQEQSMKIRDYSKEEAEKILNTTGGIIS